MEPGKLLRVPENPQQSNDGRTSHIGRYMYYRVPSGDYCVIGEKDGHSYFTIIHLEKGTVTQNVVLTDYWHNPPKIIKQMYPSTNTSKLNEKGFINHLVKLLNFNK
jgi:hypothetical protein